MVLQSFFYLLVCLNRTELIQRGRSEILQTGTPPSRIYPAVPLNGLSIHMVSNKLLFLTLDIPNLKDDTSELSTVESTECLGQ